jgi:hypothetical protein
MSTVGPNPIDEALDRELGIKKPGEILLGGRGTSARPTPIRPATHGERVDPSPTLSLHAMPSLTKRTRSMSKGKR